MRLALMIAAFAALASCGGEPDAAGPERGNAAGEVLGGEVTDDMLPLDSVRSTSPPDARAGAPANSSTPASGRTTTPSGAEPDPTTQPQAPTPPVVEPTEAPPPE